MYLLKKVMSKWTCTVHTQVVEGSTGLHVACKATNTLGPLPKINKNS